MKFKTGDRVISPKFGKGTVTEHSDAMHADSIAVQFDIPDEGLHSNDNLIEAMFCPDAVAFYEKFPNHTIWLYKDDGIDDQDTITLLEGEETE